MQRDAGGEKRGGGVGLGVRRYCTGPSGSGRKHRRKRTKDILKYAPFDIDRNGGPRNATRYVFMLTVSGGHNQYFSPCHVKGHRVDRWRPFHLSDKVTVYLSVRTTGGEPGRRLQIQGSRMTEVEDEGRCTKLESLKVQFGNFFLHW